MDSLEIFRIRKSDMMGVVIGEEFYKRKEKADQRFNEIIEEYRKNEHLASKEDAEDHHINSESISITEDNKDFIKQAMVCLWYRCSYEYDEWEITVEHLDLEKIEIVE